MKIETKKLMNLTGNIFKFNMRNKKFWVFVYLLIGSAVSMVLLGATISSAIASFDSSLVLAVMPFFNLASGISLSLLFVMFAATPLFRDKDLALYDLEKRYGYKPWEIVFSRLIWVFTMCFAAWLTVFIAGLIGGTFGSLGSKMIYIKSFIIPSVWNLYLLFLVPLLTIFISLVFGALFGKMVLYFATFTVAFSPVISNFIAVFTKDIGSSWTGSGVNEEQYEGQLISKLLYNKYFDELIIDIEEDDFFFEMVKEYSSLDNWENNIWFHLGVPYIIGETEIEPSEIEHISTFYYDVLKKGKIPTHSLIKSESDSLNYDPSIFNSYLSNIKEKKYKNTIMVLTEIFNEWMLIQKIDEYYNYDSIWDNSNVYEMINREYISIYDNSMEIAVFNVAFFSVLHQFAYMDSGKFVEPIPSEELIKKSGTNVMAHILNPLTTWGMMFSAPIQSKANLLMQSFDYSGRNPFSSLNYYFEMETIDGKEKPVVYEIVSPELIITLNFMIMIALYVVGYLLWKKQILK